MPRALKFALGLALLAGVALWLDPRRMLEDLARLSAQGLLLAIAACLGLFLLLAWRWRLLLSPASPPAAWTVKVYLYGNFLNAFTPASLGSDVYRFAALRPLAGAALVFSSLVEERLLGLFFSLVGLLLFLGLALAGGGALPPVLVQAAWAAAAAAAAMLCIPRANAFILRLLHGRLRPDVARLLAEARFGNSLVPSARLAAYAALSLGALALWTSTAALVSRQLGCDLSWPLVGAVAVLVELARVVPLTVQGLGVREAAFAALYGLCGQPPETGFAVGVLTYLILNVVFLLNGLAGLLIPAAPPQGRDHRQGSTE